MFSVATLGLLSAEEGAILGLDPIEVLLHLLNLAILVTVMTFLIYRPVKKFMKQRSDRYKSAEDLAVKTNEESANLKKETQSILDGARQKAIQIAEEAHAAAILAHDEIVQQATNDAKAITQKAADDMAQELTKSRAELVYSVTELATDIASHILAREIKPADNDAIIDLMIEDWKKAE